MPSAYVMFNVSSGSEDRVLEKLRSIPEVQEACFSYGIYDLVVKIRTDSMEQLKDLVSHRLRTMTNVISTLTLIQVEQTRIIVNT